MAVALYAPKMYGFGDQVGYSAEFLDKLERVLLFTCLLYTAYWVDAPKAAEAAVVDLQLFKDLHIYQMIDQEVANAVIAVFNRHTWYLTQELAVFALCSKRLSNNVKRDLADKLMFFERPVEYRPGKPSLPEVTESSELTDFIGTNSWLVFDILGIKGDWLEKSVTEWEDFPEFLTLQSYIDNLKVVNDTAERGIKLWSDYIGILTSDEAKRQDIVQVVEEHRGKVKARNKAATWQDE